MQPSGQSFAFTEDLELSRTLGVCVNLPTEQFNSHPAHCFMNYRLAFFSFSIEQCTSLNPNILYDSGSFYEI